MRKLFFLPILAIVLSSSSTPSRPQMTMYSPILMDREQLNNSVAFLPAQGLTKTGKIYKFNTSLFVIETYKGIHVYNNGNPASPAPVGFIRIPGCVDMAIKDNFLYADNAVDLISINLNQGNYSVVNRQQNVFPEMLPPDNLSMPITYSKEKRPAGLIIVGWESK